MVMPKGTIKISSLDEFKQLDDSGQSDIDFILSPSFPSDDYSGIFDIQIKLIKNNRLKSFCFMRYSYYALVDFFSDYDHEFVLSEQVLVLLKALRDNISVQSIIDLPVDPLDTGISSTQQIVHKLILIKEAQSQIK